MSLSPRLRSVLAGATVVSLVVCALGAAGLTFAPGAAGTAELQITFAPHVTPPDWHTEVPSSLSTSPGRGMPPPPPEEDPAPLTYHRVSCGFIKDDVCYEICSGYYCITPGESDGRVARLIGLLDKIQEKLDKVQELERGFFPGLMKDIGTCLGSAAGGVGGYYGIVALAEYAVASPEPVTKTLATVLAGGGAILLCGASVWGGSANTAEESKDTRGEIRDLTLEALFEWNEIRTNP